MPLQGLEIFYEPFIVCYTGKACGFGVKMKFIYKNLDGCENATGIVVVIDVLRAFSTAAYAFTTGVEKIALVSTLEDAFSLKKRFPQAFLMGEDRGLAVEGFDFGNSPVLLAKKRLETFCVIQRTSAGTQGVVRSKNAEVLLTSSFCCASATVRFIRTLNPRKVTFVITGSGSKDGGAEDRACGKYLEALLRGEQPEKTKYIQRVRKSAAAEKFLDPSQEAFPILDLEYCLQVDAFNFAMVVERHDDLLLMKATDI